MSNEQNEEKNPPQGSGEKVDLSQAIAVTPPEAPVAAPFITRAGVNLVKWLLVIISGFILLAFFSYGLEWHQVNKRMSAFEQELKNLRKGEAEGTGIAAHLEKAMDSVRIEQKELKAHWIKIIQLILLNVLFPVLTALLGYIFGTREGTSAQGQESPEET
jgi:hypothetical protein